MFQCEQNECCQFDLYKSTDAQKTIKSEDNRPVGSEAEIGEVSRQNAHHVQFEPRLSHIVTPQFVRLRDRLTLLQVLYSQSTEPLVHLSVLSGSPTPAFS